MGTREIIYAAAGVGGGTQNYWIADIGYTSGPTLYSTFKIAIDSSDNVYFCGQLYDTENILFIAKYDSTGVLQWQKTLSDTGAGDVTAYSIAIDSSGNACVCGATNAADGVVAKYNSSGTLQWQRTLSSNLYFFSIATDSSDNVYVTGYTSSGTAKTIVVKYNSSGTLQWQKSVSDSTYPYYGYGIFVDSSGNIYISGQTVNNGNTFAFISKMDSTGDVLWTRDLYNAGNNSNFRNVIVNGSGDVYAFGYGSFSSQNQVIAKYNSSGTIQWQRTFDGGSGDDGLCIALDSSGNVYTTGYVYDTTNSVYKASIVKYNSSGTLQWQRTLNYDPDNETECYAISVKGNSLCVSGVIGTNPVRSFIAKLPTDGSLTGTYGDWTYATSSYTDAAGSDTDASDAAAESTTTYTDAAGTLTSSTSSVPDTTTSI